MGSDKQLAITLPGIYQLKMDQPERHDEDRDGDVSDGKWDDEGPPVGASFPDFRFPCQRRQDRQVEQQRQEDDQRHQGCNQYFTEMKIVNFIKDQL